ncbi:MAG TPA: hypothetical protein VGL72_23530, partial [Bryobacteraceae bacterium]
MTCSNVRTSLSAMNDCRLREPERAAVVQHLAECDECERYNYELRFLSSALREVAPKRPPVDLTYRLRVLASHERARMITGSDWWSSLKFRFNQVFRPLAFPAVGGFLASLLAFAILVPSFTVHANTTNDVPVGLYTQVSIVNPSPFTFDAQDVMVELTIDQNGAVSDYSFPEGKLTKDQMRAVGTVLLFTSFKAATAF